VSDKAEVTIRASQDPANPARLDNEVWCPLELLAVVRNGVVRKVDSIKIERSGRSGETKFTFELGDGVTTHTLPQ